jgi:hypothetical protein
LNELRYEGAMIPEGAAVPPHRVDAAALLIVAVVITAAG